MATVSRLVSAAEAEREFGVPAHRVRVWANRKKLHASGLDRSGRPLYRVDAIAALLAGDTPSNATIPEQREPAHA